MMNEQPERSEDYKMVKDLIVWPFDFSAYRRIHFALGVPNWALIFFTSCLGAAVLIGISTVLLYIAGNVR